MGYYIVVYLVGGLFFTMATVVYRVVSGVIRSETESLQLAIAIQKAFPNHEFAIEPINHERKTYVDERFRY